MSKLALYKTHYSLGRSILTAENKKPNDPVYPVSVFDLVLHSKQNYITIVDDSITGFLQLVQNSTKNNLKLIFGLRLSVTKDILNQDEKSLKDRAKYVIFARNNEGYKSLIKIWSLAANKGFYYNPCIDFTHLRQLWNDNLMLAIPFYDSFLHVNSLEGHFHVPEFDFTKPIFFLEKNGIPFDSILRNKVLNYTKEHNLETIEAQSIYYKSKEDFIAYLTFRCISERANIEKPELPHMCSDNFNYEDWLKGLNE